MPGPPSGNVVSGTAGSIVSVPPFATIGTTGDVAHAPTDSTAPASPPMRRWLFAVVITWSPQLPSNRGCTTDTIESVASIARPPARPIDVTPSRHDTSDTVLFWMRTAGVPKFSKSRSVTDAQSTTSIAGPAGYKKSGSSAGN